MQINHLLTPGFQNSSANTTVDDAVSVKPTEIKVQYASIAIGLDVGQKNKK